jgi:Tfp pilus assembly protein PilF
MSAGNPLTGRARLGSWKEIAAFFGRDQRTVNRWEKELGLPVHRLPGTKGRVYAYTDELSAWLNASRNAGVASPDYNSVRQPGAPGLIVIAGRAVEGDARPFEGTPVIGAPVPGRYRNIGRRVAVAFVAMAAIALFLIFHASSSRSTRAVEQAAAAHGGGVVLASMPSHDAGAEQLYLKGRYYWNKRTPDDLNRALDYFMQAVVHDPNYSQAYVGLADCYNLLREYTLMPSSEAYPRALAAAKKAVELDDRSSEAHASLGFASFFGMWDLAAGEREFRRAIDLNPNNPVAHHWYANALLALHRLPEALAEVDRAQQLNPASSAILADKGNLLMVAGQRNEALSLLKQMESRDRTFRSPHVYLKNLYLRKQDYPNFLSELRGDALLMHDDSAVAIAAAAENGFALGGQRRMFEAMLQAQKKFYPQHSVSPTALAKTYALLGNNSEALRYLATAYEQRDEALLFIEIYPEFDNLHDQPAYRDLLQLLNLPPQ